jgi:glutamyl-tRNA(Gln) amidotransferase subunit E
MEFPFDPAKINLKVGLEIHQQLGCQTKLFCACPIVRTDELPLAFERRLRPAQSELGHLDPAAVFEFSKGKVNVYRWSPESSCLVEADEEPPHPLNDEAVDITILVASLLSSSLMDELHVMRKIVIDGSNTGGFQRTCVVALGGHLDVGGESVGVQTVTLEEDAARIVGEDEAARYFALDRLGVPLVEVALDPVTGPPEEVEAVALHLGRALRSTGRVARGLGTIRQDLNVSVMGGRVVEVKGVQKLNLLGKIVSYEATRQMGLIRIAEDLAKRGVKSVVCSTADVTEIMRRTGSRILQKQLKEGGRILCVVVVGLAGMFGYEPFPGVRLGRELAEVARANSLGGILHSDEFAKQGIGGEEAGALMRSVGAAKGDGLVLIAGNPDKVTKTAALVVSRLGQAVEGVPAETRAATEDGETKYMRPRPGAQRMYPETDIPEIVISHERRRKALASLPEPWTKKVERLELEYALSEDLAMRLYDSGYSSLFEELARELRLEPSVIASVLVDLPVRLAREGVPEGVLGEQLLVETLRAVDSGRIAKEAAPDVLRKVGRGESKSVQEAIESLGLSPMTQAEVEAEIVLVLKEESKLISERGELAFSPLMGEVMKRTRGRADGKLVSKLLREMLGAALQGRHGSGGQQEHLQSGG